MSTSADQQSTYPIHLLGTKSGLIKNLSGFRKGIHKVPHTLPDSSFERQFSKMCTSDLEEISTELFDKVRTARGYKRKEISLNVSPDSPIATLTTTDFHLDLYYTIEESDPREYRLVYDIHHIKDISIFSHAALNSVFEGVLGSMRYDFPTPVNVEDVIDELEDQPGDSIDIHYPPDASECTVKFKGFVGQVSVTPTSLEVSTLVGSSPAELVKTFVCAMEVLEANPALSSLIPKRNES